jgi:hypothetical protein
LRVSRLFGGARLRSRAVTKLVVLAVAVAVAGLAAASASASLFPLPGGLNQWFTSSPVAGQVTFFVSGVGLSSPPHFSGETDTVITSIDCTADGVSVGSINNVSISSNVTVTVNVSVPGDSQSPSGTQIICQGFYSQQTWSCSLFGGCHGSGFHAAGSGQPQLAATLKIDSSAPVNVVATPAQLPNANGWYNTATGVFYAGSDSNSGILGSCTGESIGGPDGQNKTASGGCENNAGLSTSVSLSYNFDGTKPTLNPSVSPNPMLLGSSATASPGANDGNGSGVDSSFCDAVDTSVLGAGSVNCTATDLAGNTNSALASYTVGLGFDGFFDPVDMNMINVAKAGQAVPLKFDIYDANGPVSDLGSVSVTTQAINCSSLSESSDAIEEYAAGGSGLQNLGLGNYQFNWKTPKTYAGTCERVHLDTGDGISHTADFQFTK